MEEKIFNLIMIYPWSRDQDAFFVDRGRRISYWGLIDDWCRGFIDDWCRGLIDDWGRGFVKDWGLIINWSFMRFSWGSNGSLRSLRTSTAWGTDFSLRSDRANTSDWACWAGWAIVTWSSNFTLGANRADGTNWASFKA